MLLGWHGQKEHALLTGARLYGLPRSVRTLPSDRLTQISDTPGTRDAPK
ncbi:hypothetical protein NCCP2716_22700 [Sporosarcina sp. NCCP-2716]|nr:hypothetical protein NCCP2716_22700 [Sporosarcina sp. NCCP-2716]